MKNPRNLTNFIQILLTCLTIIYPLNTKAIISESGKKIIDKVQFKKMCANAFKNSNIDNINEFTLSKSLKLKNENFVANLDLLCVKNKKTKKSSLSTTFTIYYNNSENNTIILNEFDSQSFYRAKYLLFKYWLEKSNFWEKNKLNKKNYSKRINNKISILEKAQIEPINFSRKSLYKNSDLTIKTIL